MNKKILVVLVLLLGVVATSFAAETMRMGQDAHGVEYFPNIGLRGANYTKTSGTTELAVGTGDVNLYSIFAVCNSTGEAGTIALTNSADTALMTLDVVATQVTIGRYVKQVWPLANSPKVPMRFTAGLKATSSTALISFVILYLD